MRTPSRSVRHAVAVEYPLTDHRRRVAIDLLTALIGHRPAVLAEEPLGHAWAPVTRLRLDRELPGGHTSAVVKTRRVEGEGYGGPVHVRREQVGLRLAERSGVTPRLLAADTDAGITLMTDIGSGPTLESVLLDGDAADAEEGFVALGRAVGRLHAATLDTESAHHEAITALGIDPLRERFGQWPGVDSWDKVEAATTELGLPDARAARTDVAAVREVLLAPSPFGALIHTDLNPTNVLIHGGEAALVDFEGSTYGHVGVDASFILYPFPNYSAHWVVLPVQVVAAVYLVRGELWEWA